MGIRYQSTSAYAPPDDEPPPEPPPDQPAEHEAHDEASSWRRTRRCKESWRD
jgi:hypothetical protein